jgi:hypothetical protein
LKAEYPSAAFPEIISDPFKVFRSKSSPGIIGTGQYLYTLEMIALLEKRSEVAI